MKKLLALSVIMAACAMPAFAEGDRTHLDCGSTEPETTGALPSDPRSLRLASETPSTAGADPSEEPWQERADEDAERRRERLVMCGVD